MEVLDYKDKHEYTNKNGVTSVVYLMDCMELLKQVPDKYFELAVVDPPYGIGKDGQKESSGKHGGRKAHAIKGWDNEKPNKQYFDLLFCKSNNQIIWGANYYPEYLKGSMGWLFWDKGQDLNQSDGELAYSSFNIALRRIVMNRVELLKEGTVHPTQKPIKLYEWQFKNYAKPNDKILDTHLGSGSSRIAADKANLPFVGCELDSDYFYASVKRFKEYSSQQTMF